MYLGNHEYSIVSLAISFTSPFTAHLLHKVLPLLLCLAHLAYLNKAMASLNPAFSIRILLQLAREEQPYLYSTVITVDCESEGVAGPRTRSMNLAVAACSLHATIIVQLTRIQDGGYTSVDPTSPGLSTPCHSFTV